LSSLFFFSLFLFFEILFSMSCSIFFDELFVTIDIWVVDVVVDDVVVVVVVVVDSSENSPVS